MTVEDLVDAACAAQDAADAAQTAWEEDRENEDLWMRVRETDAAAELAWVYAWRKAKEGKPK